VRNCPDEDHDNHNDYDDNDDDDYYGDGDNSPH